MILIYRFNENSANKAHSLGHGFAAPVMRDVKFIKH